LIEEGAFDAALLDVNLAGQSVDELAALLKKNKRPFAFATGYGREALPAAFRDALILTKPFDEADLLATIGELVAGPMSSGNVVRLELHRG
jgi:CheY-like chemotaxis protein